MGKTMDYVAHIRFDENNNRICQTAKAHCRKVAQYASDRLSCIGLQNTAFLAGLLHDMGKFTSAFYEYINRAADKEPVVPGSVNHTFAAVVFLFERYHKGRFDTYADAACEIIAYAVGAHHGQFDCYNPDGADGFLHRINKNREEIHYGEAVHGFLSQCADESEIDAWFNRSVSEIESIAKSCRSCSQDRESYAFVYSQLCRMLLSAVIDADRQDTTEFMKDYVFPASPKDRKALWSGRLAFFEKKISSFKDDTPLNKARSEISESCKRFACRENGIYRLSVPTGAGKTLSSLRYALAHSAQYKKRRIFYIIPLLSVIEQNAAVIDEYIGDASLVLEHHSNVISEPSEDTGELDERELLCENWQSPIVITTMVQFLNTLFLGKTSSIRRMNALCDSVIVIDEVQAIPTHMISLFNSAINFLCKVCRADVVLCSATQPCFEKAERVLLTDPNPDLVPYSAELWKPFLRTEILDKRIPGGYSIERFAEFAGEIKKTVQSLLIICNTRSEALSIFKAMKGGAYQLFHLSKSMCMQHRADVLSQVTNCLDLGISVVCVATQLVEAGIDFSFESVIRIAAGMDNVAQAAGRCNRNNEFKRICQVYIVNLRGEDLSRLKAIRQAQIAAEELLTNFRSDGGRFDNDLLSDKAIRYYYSRLFFALSLHPGAQSFPLPRLSTSIYQLLSTNPVFADQNCDAPFRHFLRQAFKTAGDSFAALEDHSVDVVVPYDSHAKAVIAALYSQEATYNFAAMKQNLAEAKKYTVSVYQYQLEKLKKNGGVDERDGGVRPVLNCFYDNETGLAPDGAENWTSGEVV